MMRTVKTLALLLTVATLIIAKTFYVLPNSNNLGIYKNKVRQMNEAALIKVGKEDRLKVIEKNGNYYKVRADESGTIGWVETKAVSKTDGKAYTFDDIEVEGYLDNPTPIYITDMDQTQSAPIELDRSFADALKQDTDKERIMRNNK
jgi:hypothetical protein